MVYSKFNEKATAPHHSSPHELLGVELTRAGNEYGPETQYGEYHIYSEPSEYTCVKGT